MSTERRQRRPLSGMQTTTGNGFAPVDLGGRDAPYVLHNFSTLPAGQGGPSLDEVTLYLQNTSAADINFPIVVGPSSMLITVPAGEQVRVFDQQPFMRSTDATVTSVIAAVAPAPVEAGDLFAWGWFVR